MNGYKKILSAYTRDRNNLLSMLIAVQNEMAFLSPQAIRQIGRYVGLTDNEVFSFASFYSQFRFAPFDAQKHNNRGSSLPAGKGFSEHLGKLDECLADGVFQGLSKALHLTPEDLEDEIYRSGIEEIDGADYSLVQRWQQCRVSAGEKKCLIVHAAAAEPFALDVHYLMEGNLFPVLDGMLIAAFVAGASHGIVCIDSQYAKNLPSMDAACSQMKDAGYVGTGILGSTFNFDLRFQVVDGSMLWGDDRKLIAALEGRRVTDCGDRATLYGCPAVFHSLEVLRHLPAIVINGADWYASLGVNGYPGTQIITLIGDVKKTGRYEIPMGTPLREIVDAFGGGVTEGKMLKAVQIGGPTGGWIAADSLDVSLDRQSLIDAGVPLGPGIVNVATQDACALDLARQAVVYAKEQSCGHCLFCREGTRQMAQILTDITNGVSRPEDLDVLAELAEGVKLNSACRLGRTAPDAFLSTLHHFPDEYDAHLKEKRCPAGVCGIG